MSKRRNKKSKFKLVSILIIILIIGVLCYFGYTKYVIPPIPEVTDVSLNDKHVLSVKFNVSKSNINNKIYCLFKNDDKMPSKDDKNWTLSKNNECSITLNDDVFYAYLKNEDDVIYDVKKSSTIGKIIDFKINKEQVYVAINGIYSLKSTLESIGNVDKTITWSSEDESIASVDENGKIKGIKKGNTVVHAKVMDKSVSTKVMVSDLIITPPTKINDKNKEDMTFNNYKSYLPCGKYNKDENDTLDAILKDRINDAGYKTRAGAVEAARFLTLEFPYKIRYFSENGRGSTNGVQGEGRYYNVGLYLDPSRYENIKKTMHGPKTWGCSLYSYPSEGQRMNGLDCSGFISWVLLNGGFDVGDIGAGLAPHLDLTDYGKRIDFNAEVVSSGKVKVGDLLSSGGPEGGHIAIIGGEDENYYYVAESLWTPPNVAVVMRAYSKKTIWQRYFYVMLMDDYYKEDGNLTKLWY